MIKYKAPPPQIHHHLPPVWTVDRDVLCLERMDNLHLFCHYTPNMGVEPGGALENQTTPDTKLRPDCQPCWISHLLIGCHPCCPVPLLKATTHALLTEHISSDWGRGQGCSNWSSDFPKGWTTTDTQTIADYHRMQQLV